MAELHNGDYGIKFLSDGAAVPAGGAANDALPVSALAQLAAQFERSAAEHPDPAEGQGEREIARLMREVIAACSHPAGVVALSNMAKAASRARIEEQQRYDFGEAFTTRLLNEARGSVGGLGRVLARVARHAIQNRGQSGEALANVFCDALSILAPEIAARAHANGLRDGLAEEFGRGLTRYQNNDPVAIAAGCVRRLLVSLGQSRHRASKNASDYARAPSARRVVSEAA